MKTGQFLITPASALVLAASLAFPMHTLAQADVNRFEGRAPKPVCEYKGVMSDAEIELCTGYRVRYNYAVYSGSSIAVASADRLIARATPSPARGTSGKARGTPRQLALRK